MSCRTGPLRVGRPLRGVCILSGLAWLLWPLPLVGIKFFSLVGIGKKMGVAVDALLLVLLVFFDGCFGKSGDLVW